MLIELLELFEDALDELLELEVLIELLDKELLETLELELLEGELLETLELELDELLEELEDSSSSERAKIAIL